MFSDRKKLSVLAAILAVALVVTGVVFAHEDEEAGDFVLVFGWQVEPALVGYPNGPELTIRLNDGADSDIEDALHDLDIELEVEVSFGPATKTLTLQPSAGEPGHFVASLIPTRPGDYRFHVTGNIGETEIDQVFDSADGGFSSVEPAEDVTFPDALPSVIDLLERIAELEARLAELEAGE